MANNNDQNNNTAINAMQVNLASIQVNFEYMKKDIEEIKTEVKSFNTKFATKEELAEQEKKIDLGLKPYKTTAYILGTGVLVWFMNQVLNLFGIQIKL